MRVVFPDPLLHEMTNNSLLHYSLPSLLFNCYMKLNLENHLAPIIATKLPGNMAPVTEVKGVGQK